MNEDRDGEKNNGRDITRRNFLRKTGIAGLGLTSLSALSSSAPALAQPTTEVTFATSNMPSSLEPHLNGADIWQRRKPMMYENLTRIGYDLLPKPELAKSWNRQSPTEYVFNLREGVKFHDGSEFTAEDAKYTYERILDPDVGSGGAGDLRFIDTIEVMDKYTVKFSLTDEIATDLFLLNLGGKYNGIIPKGYLPEKTSRKLSNEAMGTGPYRVVDFSPNEKIVLEKFGEYWQSDKPRPDRIIYRNVPDESSIVAGLRAGQIDMAYFWDTFNYYRVKGTPNLNTIKSPSLTIKVLDLVGDIEPTNDPRVRLAIQLGLDRGTILQIAGNGLGQRLGLIPPAMEAYALTWKELPNQERDVERAKDLLAEAGYTGTMNLKIRNIVGYPALAAAVQVIADQLSDVGINVNVETIEIGQWIKEWLEYDMINTMNAWGGFVDPDQYLYRHWHSRPKGEDFQDWDNEKADELLDEGRHTLDRDKRIEVYNELQHHMAKEAITIPLYAPELVYSMQPNIKGFQSHPMAFHYGLRFIEKTQK